MRSVLAAAAFLTRVPMPIDIVRADIGVAARWFPLIGGALGAAAAAIAWVLRDVAAAPVMLTATVITGLGAWVTGAIHLDGLADAVDGFGGGRTREDILRIMRDPVIGSFGATALVLVLATKVAAIAALLDRGSALPLLVAAPAASRWTITLLSASLPYARPEGGLGEVATSGGARGVAVSTAITLAIAFAALRSDALVAVLPALAIAAVVARAAKKRIGGVTGDVFGASVELSETAVLVTGVLVG